MRPLLKSLTLCACLFGALLPSVSHAWWNTDWKQRTKVTLNTTAGGVTTKEAVQGAVVPVRLHSGNFDFLGAKPDGSDLRLIAADDKTPLKYWIERYDSTNELALVWVQLPSVLPGSDKNLIHAYAGNEAATAEPVNAALFDAATALAIHFGEKDGPAADQTGQVKSTTAVQREANGLLASSARLNGEVLSWPGNDKTKAAGAGPWSLSLWVKPDVAQGTLFQQGPVRLSLEAGKLLAAWGPAPAVTGGTVAPATWSHVVMTVGAGKLTVYINGEQTAQADQAANAAALDGNLQVGEGFKGLIDELQVATTVRSADWAKLTHAAQSSDAKLVAAKTESEDHAEEGEGGGYLGILVKNLTPDAIAVIGLLAVMFAVAVWVMISKAMFVGRTDKANRQFLKGFREAHDVMALDQGVSRNSSLQRLYQAGLHELKKRNTGQAGAKALSGASIDAVKAAIDADMVRESHQLNSQMVLLTIAISGGPFLGLLGTVVGVMITFAAIAAAGDVNVNAIAPGIAAALLATVAGLGVAIPALFGYNYLAARIKNISSDMQIFVDEFVTRVAETYGAP